MPIYEYACADGHRFERRQGFDAAPIAVCPVCEGRSERVLHAPTVHYKGSGFYTTDYGRSGSYKSDSKSDSGDTSKSDSSAKDSGESSGSDKATATATKDAD